MIRSTLSQRRESTAFDFEHHGVRYRAMANKSGELRELFLDAGKIGTSANIMAKESAVLFSIAAQYGVPLDILFDALPKLKDGSPAGPVGMAIMLARKLK